jgi:hypothetical protein
MLKQVQHGFFFLLAQVLCGGYEGGGLVTL